MRVTRFLMLGFLCISPCKESLGHEAQKSNTNRPAIAIGTLIYTQAERHALTRKVAMQSSESAGTAAGQAVAPADSSMRIDGFVRPAFGRPVIWVNGQIENDRAELSSTDDAVIVRINQSQSQRLSPGQSSQNVEFGMGNQIIIHRNALPTRATQSRESARRVLAVQPK